MTRDRAGLLASGLAAVQRGEWAEGASAIESALEALSEDAPERVGALETLADARWWLGDVQRSAETREEVYRAQRSAGDLGAAARTAALLAREHASGLGNIPAARGWLARAETLQETAASDTAAGWIALARAMLAETPEDQAANASDALARARTLGDADLETLALARLGLALVIRGEVDDGLARLDEAMTVSTAGEASGVTTTAQLCCDLVLASELSRNRAWFGRWMATVESVAAARGVPAPSSFCTTCCAESSAAHGDFARAEQQLHLAVVELEQSGLRSRCIPPTTRLAEICLLQGRIEEAEQTLGDADDDTSLVLRARVALARGEARLSATLAARAQRRLGAANPLGFSSLVVLVEAQLADGNTEAARETAQKLEIGVDQHPELRGRGQAALAAARVLQARGEASAAIEKFEAVLDASSGPPTLEAAFSRLELAQMRMAEQPEVARVDAKAALRSFEALGATHYADRAGKLLRSLGDRSRVGPKDVGTLSRREQEVLRLVAAGLTNAEIAQRLFISTKTAGNHVSAILAKLGLRSRTEAAAYAVLHRGPADDE